MTINMSFLLYFHPPPLPRWPSPTYLPLYFFLLGRFLNDAIFWSFCPFFITTSEKERNGKKEIPPFLVCHGLVIFSALLRTLSHGRLEEEEEEKILLHFRSFFFAFAFVLLGRFCESLTICSSAFFFFLTTYIFFSSRNFHFRRLRIV